MPDSSIQVCRSPDSELRGSTSTTMAGWTFSLSMGPYSGSMRSFVRRTRCHCASGSNCFAISGTGGSKTSRLGRSQCSSAADVGRGAAFGDIDNDGDTDVIVGNNNGPAQVLLNRSAVAVTGSDCGWSVQAGRVGRAT